MVQIKQRKGWKSQKEIEIVGVGLYVGVEDGKETFMSDS